MAITKYEAVLLVIVATLIAFCAHQVGKRNADRWWYAEWTASAEAQKEIYEGQAAILRSQIAELKKTVAMVESSKAEVGIPTFSYATLRVDRACESRPWGNAVELDCKDGARIVYVQPLKQASPR